MLIRSVSTHASTSDEKINPPCPPFDGIQPTPCLLHFQQEREHRRILLEEACFRRRVAWLACAHTSSTWSSRGLRNFLVQGGNVMTLQPILIVGLVVAALLYAVAMLLYRRRGM